MASKNAVLAGKYALLLAKHNALRCAYKKLHQAYLRLPVQKELIFTPAACSYCGSTEPLIEEDHDWPYCPSCGGV